MRKPTIIETVSRYMKTDEEFRSRWLAEKEKDDKLHNKAGGMNAQRRIAKKLYEKMNDAEKKKVHELHASECKRKDELKKEVAENMETDIKEKGKELARFRVSLFIIYLLTANCHAEKKQLCMTFCKRHYSDFTHSRVGSSQSWELYRILIPRSLSHSRKPPFHTWNVLLTPFRCNSGLSKTGRNFKDFVGEEVWRSQIQGLYLPFVLSHFGKSQPCGKLNRNAYKEYRC
jgi:hypothetical protein